MQEDRATTAAAAAPAMLMHAGDNQGPTNVNDIDGVPAARAHPSLLPMDADAAMADRSPMNSHPIRPLSFHAGVVADGDAHKPLQHNPHTPHRRALEDLVSTSPTAGAGAGGRGAATAPVAAAETYSPISGARLVAFPTAEATTTGSSDDGGGPPDATPQLLQSQSIHSLTSPTADLSHSNHNTVQNTSADRRTLHVSKATSSPVITDSSSNPIGGTKTLPHALAQLQQLSPFEGPFLTAVPAAASHAPEPLEGAPRKEIHHRPRTSGVVDGPPLSGTQRTPQDGPNTSPTPSASSSSSSSSPTSVPYSTAETQCHNAAEGNGRSPLSHLPLSAAIDALTPSPSTSSFTISTASATVSPCPTSLSAVTREGAHPSTRGSMVSRNSKMTPHQHSSRVATEKSTENASDSADSPLISLGRSKLWQYTSDHRTHSPPASVAERQPVDGGSAHTRSMPRSPPPPPPISGSSGSSRTSTTPKTKAAISSPINGGTYSPNFAGTTTSNQSSHNSVVTQDSDFVRPHGLNFEEMRVSSPASQLPHADAARSPPTSHKEVADPALSSLFTLFTPPSRPLASPPHGFARSSSCSVGLPAFMSVSTASLMALPRFDASLRAAMAAAAAAAATPSRSGDTEKDSRVDVADAVLPVVEGRPPLPLSPPLQPSRVAAPLRADRSNSSATNEDGRESHCQPSSGRRTVDDSSFHSPSLAQQSSRGATVTSISFALDTPWSNTHSSWAPTRGQSSMHDSAVSLYHGSSMLSDNILQTLTHGMALGGAPASLWRSAISDASHSTSPSTQRVHTASPTPDSEVSMYANKSSNNAYVRLPHPTRSLQHSPKWRAGQSMQASTANGTAAALMQESFLYGSSFVSAEAHSSGLHSFLTSMRGFSTGRPLRASPPPEPTSALVHHSAHTTFATLSKPREDMAGVTRRERGIRSTTSPTVRSADPQFAAVPPNSSMKGAPTAAAPTHAAHRDTPIPELSTSRSQLQPQHTQSGSRSFFAAADDPVEDSGKFDRSRVSSSLLLTHSNGFPLSTEGLPATADPDADVSHERSAAPASSALSSALTESPLLVLYGGGTAADLAERPHFHKDDTSSGVARGGLPSGGFSTADSCVRPIAPLESSLDGQTTFLHSVHSAAVNTVGTQAGCSSALRYFFTRGAPATPALFSSSLAGSTGGRGVCRGEDLSIGAAPDKTSASHPQSGEKSAAKVKRDACEASCSLASTPPPPSQLPQPLTDATGAAPALPHRRRHQNGGTGDERGFGEGLSHLLPLVEPEHASMSTSARLPNLHSLVSVHHQRLATAQTALPRRSAAQRSPRAARGQHPKVRRRSTTNDETTITTDSADDSTPLPLQRSKPFSNSYNGGDIPAMEGEGDAATNALQPMARAGSRDAPSHAGPAGSTSLSKSPQNGYGSSQPYSATANRGLHSRELTHRSASNGSGKKHQGNGHAAHTGGGVTQGALSEPGSGIIEVYAVGATAATEGGHGGHPDDARHLSIPSFHRHRDVEHMLDEAETMLRRVPVPIIPVLASKLTRCFHPSLSSTHGYSLCGTETSVLSLRTPAATASTSGSDTRRLSAPTGSAERDSLD
ncbi:hypothetical protein ABB37_00961 [Leptomonas pyrrhocoris]|uniref:Uncharacterized protein n=1 Tax=Leptomonas pyrrhocoris TaxID=157538 RepID=A0A0N0E0W9_LEPPY|nr:hypothetical protein ABB37_00961 [Leptomonas pyrrhocoris]KPA86932.1 hypothetical protein ABB37_00961 [Leptomonas pyrrhocoris]|eukprot:XP_015665371.1 hypothetical protein ABB37_00961 [Leptomonas pyrrhocoris]